jgi:TonB family protein
MVQPIWQVLTDLGIEAEYCRNAVDAVERVTTQLFQIVITDWEDQPEAGFLLKTARDLKAAQRPLTLAIVNDDATLPEALKAGANSVLVKPIRVEQVRDTMSTACELLRSKAQPAGRTAATPPAISMPVREAAETAALAASASAGAATVPASVTQAPERSFRAGEFLQSPSSAPGAQFDTESEIQTSLDQPAAAEFDALTELEPMAAAVEGATEPAEAVETPKPLTGWASLQERLTKHAPPPADKAPATNELLSYEDTSSYRGPAATPVGEESRDPVSKDPAKKEPKQDTETEAALFAYMSAGSKEGSELPEAPRSKLGRILFAGILAAACVVLVGVPRARLNSQMFYRNTVHAGKTWLNPPPAPLPQTVVQHDSFGQEGDEYKLPAAGNIPDATTDPSQIRVLPVVDPTAKPEKGSEATGAQATPSVSGPTVQSQTDQNQTAQSPIAQSQAGEVQAQAQAQAKDSSAPNIANVPGDAAGVSLALQARPIPPSVQNPAPAQPASVGSSTSIPSSLKSQIASSTPEASGTMPPEAAMSSIEPVILPETAARELLAQPVDPVYPDVAKAGGLRGSVVLQVLIGRDGTVQDAKFLQGSLVFARAAIDAVKQWRFKPYSMNGRAVSVQSVISLNFRPPA